MGMLFRRYSPELLETVGYLTPVSLFSAVTAAPGIAAPVVSLTTPTILLSVACPKLATENNVAVANIATAKTNNVRSVFLEFMCLLLLVRWDLDWCCRQCPEPHPNQATLKIYDRLIGVKRL